MTIPSTVLDNWTNYESAAIESAKTTHTRIRNSLEDSSNLADVDFETFLQGSYANTTLIRGSGDVDIVVKLNQIWLSDLSRLDSKEKKKYTSNVSSTNYTLDQFKTEIVGILKSNYGASSIEVGGKAIEVNTESLPIGADIVVCMEYRFYTTLNEYPGDYIEGIVFWNETTGARIDNFPKYHRRNGEAKQEQTDGLYKETVRLFKNARNELVDRNWIEKEQAPSYFVECLLYNVPEERFENDLEKRYQKIVEFLKHTNLDDFQSQNEIQDLFGPDSTQWDTEHAESFINNLQALQSDY